MIERPDHRTPDTDVSATTEQAVTARMAADLLGFNERTIRRAILRGELPAIKRSGVFRIERDDLERYRAQRAATRQPIAPQAPPVFLLPRAPAPPPFQVPRPLSTLIGREDEVQTVQESADARRRATRDPDGTWRDRQDPAGAGGRSTDAGMPSPMVSGSSICRHCAIPNSFRRPSRRPWNSGKLPDCPPRIACAISSPSGRCCWCWTISSRS